ncbi:MAG: cytochrome c [Gammaproteobacteria bacterium]|nr:cytochrome c [Gammaproteobacteria bacterium]
MRSSSRTGKSRADFPAIRRRVSVAARASMLTVVAAAALSAGVAQAQGSHPSELGAGIGAEEFRHACASCHGADARGDGPLAQLLVVPPPDLTRLARGDDGRFPAARVYRVIDGREEVGAHGGRLMPIWGDRFAVEALAGAPLPPGVTADAIVHGRILSIVYYLESIQERDGTR